MKLGDSSSFTKTISESDVYMFAGITGDFNTLHVNKVAAEKTQFGKRIVHGMLVASLISTVIAMRLPGEGTIYLGQNCKFISPVFIGDTLTAKVTVKEYIKKEKGIVRLLSCVKNQDGVHVVDGESIVKVPPNILES